MIIYDYLCLSMIIYDYDLVAIMVAIKHCDATSVPAGA